MTELKEPEIVNEETLYLDFDDIPAFQILAIKYAETAKILDVTFNILPAVFGDKKVHCKVVLSGEKVDTDRLVKFINDSMGLL